jgi:hypothetical protein
MVRSRSGVPHMQVVGRSIAQRVGEFIGPTEQTGNRRLGHSTSLTLPIDDAVAT